MTGDTITAHRLAMTPSRAARELGLRRAELDLAVHLGLVRTVSDEGGGGRRVQRSEIERVSTGAGFPDTLRERVEVVGTTQAAGLVGVPVGRFTRLARLGLVAPTRWYLNRYRAVVWLYLADELRRFAADDKNAHLLRARRMPESLRAMLDAGVDLRSRNWRGRHRGFLLRLADDPWQRAAASAAFLDPADIDEIVPDAHERAHLHRLRPAPPYSGAPGSPSALVAERIMTAQDADEVGLLRAEVTALLRETRRSRPVPSSTTDGPLADGPAARGLPVHGHFGHPSHTGHPGQLAQYGHPDHLRRSARPDHPDHPDRPGPYGTPEPPVAVHPEEREAPRGLLRLLRRSRHPGHKALNSPSCTTDTSSRPCRS